MDAISYDISPSCEISKAGCSTSELSAAPNQANRPVNRNSPGAPKIRRELRRCAIVLIAVICLAPCSTTQADLSTQPTALLAVPVLAPERATFTQALAPERATFTQALAPERAIFTQAGRASWYGRQHQGRLTASGERFNMYRMTAAHRTLPLGTVVRVTNPANGKMVKVRINDRGPYVKGRVLDLSAAAATALGISTKGTARLLIETFASDQTPSYSRFSTSELAGCSIRSRPCRGT